MSAFATLDEAVKAWPRDRKPEDGSTTCLWHRQHEFYLANIVPLLPRCDICGGVGDPRAPRHELCRLRARDGRPTPELNTVSTCPCAKCARGVGSGR